MKLISSPKFPNLCVLVIYLLVIIAFLYPLSVKPARYIINSRFFDSEFFHTSNIYGFLRNSAGFPAWLNSLKYPEGGYLTYAGLPQLFTAAVLSLLFNKIAAYNLMLMLFTLMNCFFSFLLADYCIRHKPAAFAAGLISGFSPFIFAILYNGHIENFGVTFIPLFVLAVLKCLDERKISLAFASALLFDLIFLSSPYYVFASAIILAVLTAYDLITKGPGLPKVRFIALLYAVIICLSLPCYAYYSYESRVSPSMRIGTPGVTISGNESKPLPLLEPSPVTVIKYFFTVDKGYLYNRTSNYDSVHLYYLGWTVIIALAAGIFVKSGRRKYLWYSLLLIFIIVSFGRVLYFDKKTPLKLAENLPVYMPFFLLYKTSPLFYKLKNLYRLTYLVYLFSGIITALVISRLAGNFKPIKKYAAVFLISALVLTEYTLLLYRPLKLYITEDRVPEIYRMMAKDRGDYAVIEFPESFIDWPNIPRGLYYQTIHKKKTTSTMVGDTLRISPAIPLIRNAIYLSVNKDMHFFMDSLRLKKGRNNANIKYMENIIQGSFNMDREVLSSIDVLKAYGFRYFILHEDAYPNKNSLETTKEYLKKYLGEGRFYPLDKITLYTIKG